MQVVLLKQKKSIYDLSRKDNRHFILGPKKTDINQLLICQKYPKICIKRGEFNVLLFFHVCFLVQIDEFTTLSWSTRLKGFCICFVIGIIFSLMGSLMLFLHLGMARFAIFYTLGNIISMARQDCIYQNMNKASMINEYSNVLFH